MIGTLPTTSSGKTDYAKLLISDYQPSQEIRDITAKVMEDYRIGDNILHRTFEEFNDMSMLARMDIDQKAFNNYIQPKSDDPTQSWRWNGIKPIIRRKLLSIAAHVISLMLYPEIVAQNDKDEMDKRAAEVMQYLLEWLTRNSDYEVSFLYAVVAVLVNPVGYLEAEYVEAMQTIRQKNERGEITTKEMIDEVMSGFQVNNIPADEILIANAYEYYLQKQRFVIRRRWIDYDEAKARYGNHKNFIHVKPGIRPLYDESTATFYSQKDDSLDTLCEEIIYKNRRDDLEITFLNSVYMGAEDPADNPIKHRGCNGAPKYNIVKFGYHPIDEKRFYFYKSAAFEAAPDQEAVNRQWRLFFDAARLDAMPPTATIGFKVESNIMVPGLTTSMKEGQDIKPIGGQRNIAPLIEAMKVAEDSIEKTLISSTMEGQISEEKRTANEIARAERNARISMGVFGLMVKTAVKQFGELMVDIAINNLTVAHIEETGGLAYRNFLLANETVKGKKISRNIRFDLSMMDKKVNEKEKKMVNYKLLKEAGGKKAEREIYQVNPVLFRKMKFLVFVETGTLLPKNEAFERAMKLEQYDRMIQNPYVDPIQTTRKLLVEPFAKSDTDSFMMQKEDILNKLIGQIPQAKGQMPASGEIPASGSKSAQFENAAL